jgi:hypothetical protein
MGDFEPLSAAVTLEFDHHRVYRSLGSPRMLVEFRSLDPASGNSLLGRASVLVVVDSGASVTMLPKRYAAPLRVNLDDNAKTTIPGAGGAPVPCYEKVWLEALLCGHWVRLPVRFFVEEAQTGGLLGRAGAFDAMQLAFVHGQQLMYAAVARYS